MAALLEQIDDPAALRTLDRSALRDLARELRAYASAGVDAVFVDDPATARQALDPLGQELAEANERGQKLHSAPITAAERVQRSNPDGSIVIPAVAHGKASGKNSAPTAAARG